MGTIALLDPVVANQIAAGEVVERPASVVKELVENSLDAGATKVVIALHDGGRKRMVITDNGAGMAPEDAPLAFARHATSKLTTAAELDDLHTFGFRGEALASILAVSRVVLQTRRAADEVGIRLEGAGGVELQARPVGCPVGTTLDISDLFWNVPARQKFLRTPSTELGQILRFVDALALARPDLHLTVWHNDKKIVDYTPDSAFDQRAFAVFGKQTAGQLYPVHDDRDYEVRGLLSAPTLQHLGPSQLTLLVQGRPVSDRTLQHAIVAAYGPLLDRGRYPVGVLSLTCPVGQVDVNVHPQKTEVRFAAAAEVHAAVHRAIRPMLATMPWLQRSTLVSAGPVRQPVGDPVGNSVGSGGSWERGSTALRSYGSGFAGAGAGAGAVTGAGAGAGTGAGAVTGAGTGAGAVTGAVTGAGTGARAETGARPETGARAPALPLPAAGPWSGLRYVGQVGLCFLVCEDAGHLVLIDQHAAHERVLFERYITAVREGPAPSQALLVPQAMSLPADQQAVLLAEAELLSRLGFAVEQAGPRLLRIVQAPTLLRGRDLAAELADLAASLLDGDRGRSLTERLERTAATLACHAAFRAGDPLQPEAVQHLLAAMDQVDLSGYCPHGRPAVMRMPLDQLGRLFHRS